MKINKNYQFIILIVFLCRYSYIQRARVYIIRIALALLKQHYTHINVFSMPDFHETITG